jgi:predicted nuclease of predicted toxin-antitoxin system
VSLRLLLDMNISPLWAEYLERAGHEARHWSNVGDARAADDEIFAWAAAREFVILTHDLDFGALLAATAARSPSVVLLRAQGLFPAHAGRDVVQAIATFESELTQGAILVIDRVRRRLTMLPLRR